MINTNLAVPSKCKIFTFKIKDNHYKHHQQQILTKKHTVIIETIKVPLNNQKPRLQVPASSNLDSTDKPNQHTNTYTQTQK